jgi:hypothetical protein
MRSTPPRLTSRFLIVLTLIALITFLLGFSENHTPSSLPRSALNFAQQRLPGFGEFASSGRRWDSDDGTCFGWDPHGMVEDDPPDCLRAKQFRQVQQLRKVNPR